MNPIEWLSLDVEERRAAIWRHVDERRVGYGQLDPVLHIGPNSAVPTMFI
jgi:hypothetical protein